MASQWVAAPQLVPNRLSSQVFTTLGPLMSLMSQPAFFTAVFSRITFLAPSPTSTRMPSPVLPETKLDSIRLSVAPPPTVLPDL